MSNAPAAIPVMGGAAFAVGDPFNVGPTGPRPLILEVNTANAGTTASDVFRLALKSGESYDFSWSTNDGTSGTHNTDSNLDLTFPSGAGVYKVYIYPQDDYTGFAGFYYNHTNDDTKITELIQWGDIAFEWFQDSFEGCNNMVMSATDTCNTDAVTSMRYAFSGCSSMVSPPTFSTVSASNNFQSVFSGCNSMSTWPTLDFSDSLSIAGANVFSGCTSLTGTAPSYDLSQFTSVNLFFSGCTGITETPLYDTSSVTIGSSMTGFFSGCTNLVTIGGLKLDGISGSAGSNIFLNCSSATSIGDLGDLSGVTSGLDFYGMSSMTTFPTMDVSGIANFSNFFRNCSSLVTAPALTTTSATDFGYMFNGCDLLTTVPVYDTSGVLSMDYTFVDCAITDIPAWDYSGVTNMTACFSNCDSLVTTSAIDVSSATTIGSMYSQCSSLTTIGDITTTTSLTNVSSLCNTCASLTAGPNISVTSNVTSWSYMFLSSSITSCPTYDTSGGGSMTGMFQSITSTTLDIPAFDFSAVTSLADFCRAVNPNGARSTPAINAPLCTSAKNFGTDNYNLETIGTMTLTGLTTASHGSMFSNARNVRGTVNITLSANVTSLNRAFRYFGANSTGISMTLSGTSGVTNWGDCFQSGNLTSINLVDTSSGTNLSNFLIGNTGLEGFAMPTFDLGSLTSGTNIFSGFAMTTTSYSDILIALEANNSNNSYSFHGGNAEYNVAGGVARAALVADHSVTFTDGGPE